jgi:hypothetical protein
VGGADRRTLIQELTVPVVNIDGGALVVPPAFEGRFYVFLFTGRGDQKQTEEYIR